MYFDDLSPYTYNPLPSGTGKNVGWLASDHPFETGPVPNRFLNILRGKAARRVNPGVSYHPCDICGSGDPGSRGRGEIHVYGEDGTLYIAPTLIVHYVGVHQYLPPQEFIDAVLQSCKPFPDSYDKSDRLLYYLADLASEAIQVRYCVNCTRDEYLAINHVLGYFLDSVYDRLRIPDGQQWLEEIYGKLAAAHMTAIYALWDRNRGFLDKYTFETLEDLILRDPVWLEIREHARTALSIVGYDLDSHEAESLEQH